MFWPVYYVAPASTYHHYALVDAPCQILLKRANQNTAQSGAFIFFRDSNKMLNRRDFLKRLFWLGAGAPLLFHGVSAAGPVLRVALLHMAPVPGDISGNRLMVEKAVRTAAAHNAQWIVTPELCTSGYGFSQIIGTDWVHPQPDPWTAHLSRLAATLGVTVFLSQAEKDPLTGKLYNSVFVIGRDGKILGKHRKIRTLHIASEKWSTSGERAEPFYVPPLGNVGILICADAFPTWIARRLKEKGADILISPASWGKGPYGPSGEWERCSQETGLTMLVCNRTGMDRPLDFRNAESAVISNGRRLHTLTSEFPAIFLVDLDLETKTPLPRPPVMVPLMLPRLISLSPATTEIIFALEAQKRLVAVTTGCDYPQEAKNIPTVGGFVNIDFDAIGRLKPDMVFTSTLVQTKIAQKLKQLGFKTVHIDPKNLNEVFQCIMKIGEVLDVPKNAELLIQQMKNKIENIAKVTGQIKQCPRVYIEEYPDPPYVCGNWIPELIKIAGGKSLLKKGRSRIVSTEEIREFDPQIIIISWCGSGNQTDMNRIISRKGWDQIDAIKNKRIIFINESLLNRPGPRIVQGLETLLKIIHPELMSSSLYYVENE